MKRLTLSPRWMTGLVLILASLACNIPVETRFNSPSKHAQSSQAEPTPISFPVHASPTPLQPEAPAPTFLPPTAAPPPAYQPVFEPSGCAFPLPAGTNPDCGYLVVPENRTWADGATIRPDSPTIRPDSPTIRLHVAIFRSHSPSPAPDPVIYLAGGPGSSALALAGYLFRQGIGGVLDTRDLIFIDQRGTGYSEPALTCPEREAVTPALLAGQLSAEERQQAIVEAFQRCRDRLSAQGIDLSAYHSAAIAADVDDLRRALGYEKINLYGVSYGTRLALTMMRDYPASLRSVVLDSTLPLQVNLYTALAPNAERAFNVLFERCAADAACSAAYPDLHGRFYRLVDLLNASPLPLTVAGYPVRLDGSLLIDVLFVGLYNPASIAEMPQMITGLEQGQTAIIQRYLGLYFDPSTALGMQMSLICAEELPFSPPNEAFALAQTVQPQIAAFFPQSVQPLFAACQRWGAAAAGRVSAADPRENQAVTSAIPTLVLAGEFDPITPPEWGRLAAASLSQAYFFEFPANGHWVTRSSSCARGMMFAFLQNPGVAPDGGCVGEMPGVIFRR